MPLKRRVVDAARRDFPIKTCRAPANTHPGGHIWACTCGGGILAKGGRFCYVMRLQGFPCNTCPWREHGGLGIRRGALAPPAGHHKYACERWQQGTCACHTRKCHASDNCAAPPVAVTVITYMAPARRVLRGLGPPAASVVYHGVCILCSGSHLQFLTLNCSARTAMHLMSTTAHASPFKARSRHSAPWLHHPTPRMAGTPEPMPGRRRPHRAFHSEHDARECELNAWTGSGREYL